MWKHAKVETLLCGFFFLVSVSYLWRGEFGSAMYPGVVAIMWFTNGIQTCTMQNMREHITILQKHINLLESGAQIPFPQISLN